MDYVDIPAPGVEDNMGGLKQTVFMAPIRDFTTIANIPATPTSLTDLANITGNHTFPTGKGFIKVYCTLDKGKIDDEPQGDRDGYSFKSKATIFIPNAQASKLGFYNQLKNDKCIWLFPMPDGKIRQLGTADFYAEAKIKGSTGTNSSGTRGFEIEIEAMGPNLLEYSGTITSI